MRFRRIFVRLAKHGLVHSAPVVALVQRVPTAPATTTSTRVLQAHRIDITTASARTHVWHVARATTAVWRDLLCVRLAPLARILRRPPVLARRTA